MFEAGQVPLHTGQLGRHGQEWYEPDVVEQILGQCSTRAATGVRDQALLVVTWRAALRADCEALALDPDDIKSGKVRVRNGKGGKTRTVTISAGAVAILDRWMGVRGRLGLGRRDALFCTLAGRRVSYPAFDAMFKRRARKAHPDSGLRWHLHALRHSRAVEMERAGTPVSIISAFLGHASLGVTTSYLNGLRRVAEIEAAGDDDWRLVR